MPKERVYKKGEHIGPYEVIALISPGSMGNLYEARPLPELRGDLLDRGIDRVMVKVARQDTIPKDPEEQRLLRERLDREFKTLMALRLLGHPNIVDVYDFGWESGVPYYAMELVDGLTLAEALKHRPHQGQILRVYAELCGAVLFLHDGGICHRDIKPDNVMLRRDGGSPVLIDFGTCLPPTGYRLTGPRELLGTHEYLSPGYAAHLLGRKRARPYLATAADDVWAMGITLYEILTGAVPWKTPPGSEDALLREIKRGRVRHPCEVNEEVSPELGALVMRMLEPDRRARLQNVGEVLELLGAAAEHSNTLGRVPSPRERHGERALGSGPSGNERGQASAGLLAVAGLAMVMFTVGSVYGGAVALSRMRTPLGTHSAGTSQASEKATPEHGIPKEISPRQKLAPCDAGLGESEFNGGCWSAQADVQPPCGRLFRNGNKCYRRVRADPNTPVSDDAQ